MAPDGVCRVDEHTYSKTIRFRDINYQLAQNEEKTGICEGWCDFLNYFDSSIGVQISFINRRSSLKEFRKVIDLPERNDEFDDLRREFGGMIRRQLASGHNGIVRDKYITFSVQAENVHKARATLKRIEGDVLQNFKVLGVQAEPLDGAERLRILYDAFHPGSAVPFRFDYRDLLTSGLSTKDYVAPSSFTFRDGRSFLMGDTPGAASWLQILAPEMSDEVLADFLAIDASVILNLHIRSVDQLQAVKMVKGKVTDLNKMKIEAQKEAVRAGYDMDILPTDLMSFTGEASRLLEDLQSRNERMFLLTITFLNTEPTRQELETVIGQMEAVAQKRNCLFKRLDYLQEEGLMSSIPLGVNFVPIQRALTTTSTSIFIPFTTQELFMEGESLYYGLNDTSGNMIMVDRKKLKNPNGLILGTPGSGKSFTAKREMTNAFFATEDDIIICDPEAEYGALVEALGGQVITLSAGSRDHVNPLDINLDYSEDDDPLGFKSDFILSFFELILNGTTPQQRSVIIRCLPMVYEDYFKDPRPENMPVLGDLHRCIRQQEEPAARDIATSLEMYVKGSLSFFNHRTNVKLDNRIVCFDIRDLGKNLKKLGMLVVQDQVWNRVTVNRSHHRATRYYVDEFHLLLREEQTAAWSVEIWKRFRKWGGIPTGITQNIKDLLLSSEIENIFENSDFIIMLNQAAGDRSILQTQLNISPQQLIHVTNAPEGSGLLFYGNTILPFRDRLDPSSRLYALITTKPGEVRDRDARTNDAAS